MIKAVVGGVGSGKTLSIVRDILIRKKTTFLNFDIKAQNCIRLKKEDFIKDTVIATKKSGEEVKQYSVNWDFWRTALDEHPEGFDIVLDEAHNIISSRRSMSSWNTQMTFFIAQIRKIMGSSGHHHFVWVTQVLDRVDVAFRDLMSEVIVCKKFERDIMIKTPVISKGRKTTRVIPYTFIVQYHFEGSNCYDRAVTFMADNRLKIYDYKTAFFANPIMERYDSYAFIDFGDDVYL